MTSGDTTETTPRVTMEEVTALAKRRGFIFQSSEIYGGIGGFFDYGPLGAILKRNVKAAWWRDTVEMRDDVVAWRDSFLAALQAAREAPDAERPWRVPPMAGHLIEDRETLELRLARQNAPSATGWRSPAPS